MKPIFRLLIILISFCLVLPFMVSCAEAGGGKKNPGKLDGYYDNSSREKTSGNLPDWLDLDGEKVGFYYFSELELSVVGEDEKNDIVYTSIYERNQKVEAWLNMEFDFYPSASDYWGDVSGEVSNLILTNDGSLDVVIAGTNSIIQNKLYSLFLDLSDCTFLELNQPWWNEKAIKETSIDGRVYEFLFGDMLLSCITSCGAIFYNKTLYANFYPEYGPDHLYQVVQDHEWTLDKFYLITNNAYLDKNGDNIADDTEDIYAFQLFRYAEPIHQFANCADVEYYQRMKNGYPKITINSAKSIGFTEKLSKILYQNQGANLYYPNQIGAEKEHPHDFQDGRILFNLTSLGAALGEEMRQMTDDYGIIPYPLYDESQEQYKSLMANGTALACVPYSAAQGGNSDRVEDIIAPTLEAMSIEAYRSVTANFYELALKSAYTRDDVASEMIDIIVTNSTKNFLYEYSSSLSGIGTIFNTCMNSQGTLGFATQYAKIGEAAEALLNDLIKEYKEIFP